jgi:hypothetical protein
VCVCVCVNPHVAVRVSLNDLLNEVWYYEFSLEAAYILKFWLNSDKSNNGQEPVLLRYNAPSLDNASRRFETLFFFILAWISVGEITSRAL